MQAYFKGSEEAAAGNAVNLISCGDIFFHFPSSASMPNVHVKRHWNNSMLRSRGVFSNYE